MSFQEKIDKILKDNKLGINTVFGLEAFIKASVGSISKPLNKGEEPGLGTIKKILEGLPGLNKEWWDTGKGEVFPTNSTGVQKANDNKQNGHSPKETFYTDLIEQNEEYSLIPRAVLKDYKIVPDKIIDVIIASNENEKKAIEKAMLMQVDSLHKDYDLAIQGYENKVNRLQGDIDKLEVEKEELLKKIEDLERKIPANTK